MSDLDIHYWADQDWTGLDRSWIIRVVYALYFALQPDLVPGGQNQADFGRIERFRDAMRPRSLFYHEPAAAERKRTPSLPTAGYWHRA